MSGALVEAVRRLYEAYPYPHYPLLAKPAWQDGYLAASLFAGRMARDLTPQQAGVGGRGTGEHGERATVLIGGAGEILPYIIRRWEPAARSVLCLDVSARSLRRARVRLLASPKRTDFVRGDLHDYLAARLAGPQPGAPFQHIDAYGVLHHMPDPGATIALLARSLAPGGTMRVMVYNSPARRWLTALQRAFALLGVDRHAPDDLAFARALLAAARGAWPRLDDRLTQLGAGTLANDARFVDTFLHAREARLPVQTWLARLAAAGLQPVGLLDRYGELDELPNPLWHAPSAGELAARAEDGRFENNLELYLLRPRGGGGSGDAAQPPRGSMLPLAFMRPPRLWFAFDETRGIPLAVRIALWHAHLAWTLRGERRSLAFVERNVTNAALQRLARIGAILPGQVEDAGARKRLLLPMVAVAEHAEPRAAPPMARRQAKDEVERLVLARLERVFGAGSTRRARAVRARLERAGAG